MLVTPIIFKEIKNIQMSKANDAPPFNQDDLDWRIMYPLVKNSVDLTFDKDVYTQLEKDDHTGKKVWEKLIGQVRDQAISQAERAQEIREEVKCSKGHDLRQFDGHFVCDHDDCIEHKHYYPKNMIHKYSGEDQTRPLSILNNDTTSWIVQDEDPAKVLTRKDALEAIIAQSVKRSDGGPSKVQMADSWTNARNIATFNDRNGHNAMILCKLIKNVVIIWDYKFQTIRRLFGWSKDKKGFTDKALYEAEHKDKADIGEWRGEVYSQIRVGDFTFLIS